MFTGIIEELATVVFLKKAQENLHITCTCEFINELKINQSIAHNGVCLTIVNIEEERYTVTAIKETLKKTNMNTLKLGDKVNIERSLKFGDRLDGHIVQGHVDQTAKCISITKEQGSYIYAFLHEELGNSTVEKGSVCLNGVSLTVLDSKKGLFSVAIIPYTFQHTNFKYLKVGDLINIEFDILGKYISKISN